VKSLGVHAPFSLRLRRIWCRIVHGDPDWGLPKFEDLRGIAPDITGDKSVEEFLRDIRKED